MTSPFAVEALSFSLVSRLGLLPLSNNLLAILLEVPFISLALFLKLVVLLNMLGNVVISKKFLLTRKIMVMHSNERGECRLRTLVDRKRKRQVTRLM